MRRVHERGSVELVRLLVMVNEAEEGIDEAPAA